MWTSGVLGALLLIFMSINCQENISIRCTESWLQVRLRRMPIVENLQPQPNELYLGDGCPVSIIEPDYFEFLYIISLCGIRVQGTPSALLIESIITYDSPYLNSTYHIPVSCYVQRHFPIFRVMKPRRDYVREAIRAVGQKCSIYYETDFLGIHPEVRFSGGIKLEFWTVERPSRSLSYGNEELIASEVRLTAWKASFTSFDISF